MRRNQEAESSEAAEERSGGAECGWRAAGSRAGQPASPPPDTSARGVLYYSPATGTGIQYNVVYRVPVHTKWKRPLSGVHSIMMEKFSHAGCARVPPFALFTITYKVAVYTPAERADTLNLSLLYLYMYSVVLYVLIGTEYTYW